MSRTIRRKNNIGSHRFSIKWWITDYEARVSKYGGRYFVRVPLQGKALAKETNKYHSDSNNGYSAPKWFRKMEHSSHRISCKLEIVKYYKDDGHEIQILNNPKWGYWD